MKYYIIESIPNALETKVRVFRANGVEEFCTFVPIDLLIGYCRCLEDFGYMSESFLKTEQKAHNFHEGLEDMFEVTYGRT